MCLKQAARLGLLSVSMKTANQQIEAFLEYCASDRRLSPHSVKAYRLDLNAFRAYLSGDSIQQLEEITAETLRDFVRTLGHLKPRSIKRKIATIKTFFGFLKSSGVLIMNNLEFYRSGIRMGKSLPRIVSRKAVGALLRSVNQNGPSPENTPIRTIRDRTLLELLFGTGMRVSEVSNLRRMSVDLLSEKILVNGKEGNFFPLEFKK